MPYGKLRRRADCIIVTALVNGGITSGAPPRMTTARNMDPFSPEKTVQVPRFQVIGGKNQDNFDRVTPFLIARHWFNRQSEKYKKIKGLLMETLLEALSLRSQK